MECYDVCIVGGGLAGLQCARLLAGNHVKVLLVDRKSSLRSPVHTTGIFVRKTLEDFDLPERFLGPPVRQVRIYSPRGRSLTLSSHHDEFRVGHMGELYEHLLAQAVSRGCTWLSRTQFVAAEPSRGGSIVRLQTEEREFSVECRLIIGADGAHSRVAAALGLGSNRELIVGVEEVWSGVAVEGEPAFHCFLDAQLAPGYLAWLVNDGEQTHVGVGGYSERFHPVIALQEFKARLRELVDWNGGTLIEKRGGKIPVGGVLRRLSTPRGILVGDAAGAVSPLTAGGLDGAMRLSRYAATVVTSFLARGDSSVLEQYSGEMFQARLVSRQWMRRAMSRLGSNALIEVACAAMAVPPLRQFAWQVFFGRHSFPDVSRTLQERVTHS